MKRADRLGADYVVILGENELKAGAVSIKDMRKVEQMTLPWDKVTGIITAG